MAATALATQITGIVSPTSSLQPSSFFMFKTGVRTHPATTSSKRISLVRASQGEREDKAAFISQEDLKYLVQLGAGSVAGAAAIKYGSVVFPEITRPNLPLALFMISAPVVVAVFLLIKQSRVD